MMVCGDGVGGAMWTAVRVSDCVGHSVWVALCGLRCVGDDVGDGIWVKVR